MTCSVYRPTLPPGRRRYAPGPFRPALRRRRRRASFIRTSSAASSAPRSRRTTISSPTVASRARKRRESCASRVRITWCATATSSTSASTSRIAAMELQYGQATVKDLPQLVELLHVLFTDEAEFQPNAEKQRRALEAILANPAIGKVFVAREGKRVVAMASLLYTVSTAEGGKAALFEDLVVHRSEEHTSELQSPYVISYAVFC